MLWTCTKTATHRAANPIYRLRIQMELEDRAGNTSVACAMDNVAESLLGASADYVRGLLQADALDKYDALINAMLNKPNKIWSAMQTRDQR